MVQHAETWPGPWGIGEAMTATRCMAAIVVGALLNQGYGGEAHEVGDDENATTVA